MAGFANVPKGGKTPSLGMGIAHTGGKVNKLSGDSSEASTGVPYGQVPGIGNGSKKNSMNQLPSTSRVVKPAPSNLMTGMSSNRGKGGNK